MTKARLHPSLLEFRGAMGDMVFRQRNGKVFVSIKSNGSTGEPSAAQTAHRQRFRKAVNFGKLVMASPDIRPLYEQAAKDRGAPIYAVCIADYLNDPTITDINPIDYRGNVGDPITILASDDFGVVRVDVMLADADLGTLIESGQAVETPAGSGQWIYFATQPAAAGITVQFQATVFDRPGGTAIERGTKRI